MKICHVNLASGFSGGERQTLTLIREQLRTGYQVVVVANPKSPFVDEVRKLQCELYLCSQFLLSHSAKITKDSDAVHVHEGRAVYWALIQHLLTGCPYIITRRIDNPVKKKKLLNLAYRKAKYVVGLSAAIIDEILASYPAVSIAKVPDSPVLYPSNSDQVQKIKTQYANKFLIIHAAKLYDHKGFDVTIDCARLLEPTHPNLHFALLGDGPEEDALKQRAEGLTNLSFMGRQTNMGDWFTAADLLIHPSYSEGLGSVILEAIKAGVAVVASKAGGIPDIVEDGVNGLLVEAGNPTALANSVARIASDDELREQLVRNATEKLKPFEIEHTAKLYEKLYTS